MLKRIYIDNYKSLVNFEVSLNEINLFLGVNGAGKSAVFEMLERSNALWQGIARSSSCCPSKTAHAGKTLCFKPLNWTQG